MSEAARSEQLAVPALMDAAALPVVTAPVDPLDGIPRALIARALAKAEIVAAFRACRGRSCRTLNATGASFVERYNSENEKVSAETRALYPTIEWPSLQRDWRRFEKSGISGLIPGYGGRRGDTIIARIPLMREFVIAQIAHNPRVRARFVLDGIGVRFANDRIPDLRSVERFIRDWKRKNGSLFQRVADPDLWKSRHMLALGDADAGITRVGQLFEIDGTKSDAFVLTEIETKTGKMQMIAVLDVKSRRMVAHLAPSESSQAIAELLIKAFPILGIPDEIKSDRGAASLSERTQRAMARLGIKWTAVRAYCGEKKPFIERGGMGSVLHGFFENVPGYSGHSPAEASAIRKRASFAQRRGQNLAKLYRVELTGPELQGLLDRWLEHLYGNRKHRGLGGRTPNEVFAEAERRGQVRRVADDRLLDLILGEDGAAVVGKKGLRVGNVFYWDDALVEHVGGTVQFVRTRDAGKLIVYTADAAPRFICIAVDPEALGLDREVLAIAAKQRQTVVMRQGMDELRALKRKHRPDKLYREILDHAVAKTAAMLPAPAEAGAVALPYRSAALTAAAAALEALDAPAEPAPHDESDLREGAEALRELMNRKTRREALLNRDQLWDLWIAIRRAGRPLTEREQAFLSRFGNTAESWAISYESTSDYQAGLDLERWSADEGQAHDEGKSYAH